MLKDNLKKILKTNIKSKFLIIAAVLIILAVLYILTGRYYFLGQINDDARHIMCANALLQFHYNDLSSLVQVPVINQLPGYPLLLTLPILLGKAVYTQYLSVLFTLAAAVLALVLFKKKGIPLALIFALHPTTVVMSTTVMTEPAYMFWSFLILWLLAKNRIKPVYFILISAFIAWIRPHGFLLLIAVYNHYAAQFKLKKKLAYFSLASLAVFLPYIRNFLITKSPASYFSEIPQAPSMTANLSNLLINIKSNLAYYFFNVPLNCLGFNIKYPSFATWWIIFAVSFWILFLYGAVKITKNKENTTGKVYLNYIVIVLMMHLFWVNQSVRYVYILMPFIFAVVFTAIENSNRIFKILFTSLILLIFGYMGTHNLKRALAFNKKETSLYKSIEWIKNNTKKSAVLMAEYRHSMYFWTERKTSGFYYHKDPDIWFERLLNSGISYFYVNDNFIAIQKTPIRGERLDNIENFLNFQLKDKNRFELVYEGEYKKVRIYKLKKYRLFRKANLEFHEIIASSNLKEMGETIKKLLALKKTGVPLKRLDFVLGTAYYLAGKNKTAVFYLQKAAKKEPYFKQAKINLGLAYKRNAKKK